MKETQEPVGRMGWVSAENNPPQNGYYICWCKENDKGLIYYHKDAGWQNGFYDELVTHWMYLIPPDQPTPPPAPIKTEGEDERSSLFKIYKEALETIANDEGSCCQRCEGNGRLWADGMAHYPSYEGPTIPCGNCGGEGRIYEDIKQIAIDALNEPAPPSPVGIKKIGDGRIVIDGETYVNEKSSRVLSATEFNEKCKKQVASLPQSSTEEEKDLWEEVANVLYGFETGRRFDINELLSTYKISKR